MKIADSVQVIVMINLILQHEFDDIVKKIFSVSLIELQPVASSLDQVFDYLLIALIVAEVVVKKLLNVE